MSMTLLRSSLPCLALCAGFAFSQPAFAQPLSAGCSIGEQATIPLTFTEDMRPVAQASINGATVPVMVSTAAEESLVLNKKVLERLGIAVRSSTGIMRASDERNPKGVDILRDVSHAVLDDFSFGLVKGRNAEYFVEDFMDDRFGVRAGARTLLKTDLEVALDAGYLKAFKPNGCFREHLAYWDPQAVAVDSRGDPWKRDPRVVFSVRIGGKEVWALLSTSTPYSYLPKAAAARLGLTPESPGATREEALPGDSADKPVWKVPVPLMSVGSLEVKDSALRLMDLPHSGEILVLGVDFLHRHRVYIAMSQNKIYFSPIVSPRALKRGSVNVIPQAIN
jgi:predicted aspartyl protease